MAPQAPSVLAGESAYSTTIQNNPSDQGSNIFFGEPKAAHKNIVIPYVVVISEGDTTREGKYSGLNLKAAFQREGENIVLQLSFTNSSQAVLNVAMW